MWILLMVPYYNSTMMPLYRYCWVKRKEIREAAIKGLMD